jgi:hypothetical protein
MAIGINDPAGFPATAPVVDGEPPPMTETPDEDEILKP